MSIREFVRSPEFCDALTASLVRPKRNVMNLHKVIAVAALICALLSLFVGGLPWLVIAVILLAVLHLV